MTTSACQQIYTSTDDIHAVRRPPSTQLKIEHHVAIEALGFLKILREIDILSPTGHGMSILNVFRPSVPTIKKRGVYLPIGGRR
ncbi:hypothetical protein [Paramagnetospirillum kuznetsovii]|uniref:hypothetical protein n=1 Tax=Paramagnetospirillum kuznetsovii TaxID=2053833 RepID=UPI0011BE2439|nr:hypothetical protein [Paramagnetospirillum kuznetsovii]